MLVQDPVRLRAIERGDLPQFVAWFNDPEIRHYVGGVAPVSAAGEERWFDAQLDESDSYRFTIEARLDDVWRVIGNCGIHEIDWHARKAPIGIVIGEREQWNRGFGTLALTILLRFGFGEVNLNRLELEVLDSNARAIRCYEKVGFRREAVRREALFQGGEYHDWVVMGALREDFSCW